MKRRTRSLRIIATLFGTTRAASAFAQGPSGSSAADPCLSTPVAGRLGTQPPQGGLPVPALSWAA